MDPKPGSAPAPSEKQHEADVEEILDDALADTFPASDPVAYPRFD
jgi:hypothetical protein